MTVLVTPFFIDNDNVFCVEDNDRRFDVGRLLVRNGYDSRLS